MGEDLPDKKGFTGLCLAILLVIGPVRAGAQEDDAAAGRDFPKTLTLDEPGIDDEISFPTVTRTDDPLLDGRMAAASDDVAFEIDKRLTEQLDLQLTGGWRSVDGPEGVSHDGWDNATLTSKYVLLDQAATESIVTAGIIREFGRSGAAGVGADNVSSTLPILYFGQGFGATGWPAPLRALAITGGLGLQIPDRAHGAGGMGTSPAIVLQGSLQYSLKYLAAPIEAAGLPRRLERFLFITEIASSLPANHGGQDREAVAAPGLIYAGSGYQLAVEALLPLTRASGRGVGGTAQLNISFRRLGLAALAGTLW